MNLAKNILAMLLVTGTLWGCSLSQEREAGKWFDLAGSDWQIQDIDGQPVEVDSEVTIRFAEEGRVYGNSSCNRYHGGWSAEGSQLEFSQMAATRMACPDNLMHQENRFLRLLGDVQNYRLEAGGRLVLETVNGTRITAVASDSEPE
ncbi:META domain-containing protein [Marinobacter sp.]|uniref:META domain-containing protein n=1 Tax=Marinobacter sp. TaxID=50741 RepID=UPI0019E08E72|nr:META domain-containing protein [Marinobacter sp.]MBE0486273.1 META domain-containing protein [Marinobacter sp.]